MKNIFTIAAIAEATMGLMLLVVPSFVGTILIGGDLSGISIPLARVTGIALLALGIACLPGRRAMIAIWIYGFLTMGYLLCLAIRGEWAGPLLWPAIIFHAVITVLLTKPVLAGRSGIVLLMMGPLSAVSCLGEGAHWSYEHESGPEHWATLSPEFSACAGKNQSPIDLVTAKMIEAELNDVAFDYNPSPLDVINNGHTIQVNYAPGSQIVVDGVEFALKQFHFHSPSENQIDGRSYPMEAHLVHADAGGNLAVVAVLFEEGAENGFISRIWNSMPRDAGESVNAENETVDADGLLPADHAYYRFNGSLTTPPCTEGVRWLVCKATAEIAPDQVAAFRDVVHHDNNRPVQAVNARPVLK